MKRTRILPIGLIAAAWLGVILCPLYACAIAYGAKMMAGMKVAGLPASPPSMPWTTGSQLLLVTMLLLQLWGLWQLRGIGAALLQNPGISRGLATAFRRLGHALLAFGLFGLVLPIPSIHRLPGLAYVSPERFSFPTLYLLAIGCLCIYATAWLLNESVRLKEENEAFV